MNYVSDDPWPHVKRLTYNSLVLFFQIINSVPCWIKEGIYKNHSWTPWASAGLGPLFGSEGACGLFGP